MPASVLSCTRCAKSAFGDQNAKLKKLTLSRPHLINVTFSDARSVSPLRNMRPASLPRNAGLRKSVFPKCHWLNATISNARSASLLSRGTRPASQSQNARVASFLQNVSSASLNPVFQICDPRLAFRS